MSRRYNFSKEVKRLALKRSGGLCEATGKRYGYEPFHRCNRNLAMGIEFDHYPLPAYQEGSDTLENCLAACVRCNQYAANNTDKTRAAKEKRVSDKHLGIKKTKQKIPSRGFRSYPSNTKQLREDFQPPQGDLDAGFTRVYGRYRNRWMPWLWPLQISHEATFANYLSKKLNKEKLNELVRRNCNHYRRFSIWRNIPRVLVYGRPKRALHRSNKRGVFISCRARLARENAVVSVCKVHLARDKHSESARGR